MQISDIEDSPKAGKIFVSSNLYHLFDMQNEEVNFNFYTDAISSNTAYQVGTYTELGFDFQYNSQEVDGIESINAAKDTITYKKQTADTTGYQVQYSTTKDFSSGVKNINITKNKTTSTTKKKLKAKKKYYVRIRTYKKVGGKKIYSTWSSLKSIKTKK